MRVEREQTEQQEITGLRNCTSISGYGLDDLVSGDDKFWQQWPSQGIRPETTDREHQTRLNRRNELARLLNSPLEPHFYNHEKYSVLENVQAIAENDGFTDNPDIHITAYALAEHIVMHRQKDIDQQLARLNDYIAQDSDLWVKFKQIDHFDDQNKGRTYIAQLDQFIATESKSKPGMLIPTPILRDKSGNLGPIPEGAVSYGLSVLIDLPKIEVITS